MTQISIDITKANREFDRMLRGEIPFDSGYLNELVETDDDDINVEFTPTCDVCGSPVKIVNCDECAIAPRQDCSLCDGVGWWFECPKCSEDEG